MLCPKCGEPQYIGTLHDCSTKCGTIVKVDVLKLFSWLKEKLVRKWNK